MLQYKGYLAKVDFDDSIMALHGYVLNTADEITFEATDVSVVEEEFRHSVDEYLEYCREKKIEPEKPFSGVLNLRLGSELHKTVSLAAATEGLSLNTFIKDRLEEVLR